MRPWGRTQWSNATASNEQVATCDRRTPVSGDIHSRPSSGVEVHGVISELHLEGESRVLLVGKPGARVLSVHAVESQADLRLPFRFTCEVVAQGGRSEVMTVTLIVEGAAFGDVQPHPVLHG